MFGPTKGTKIDDIEVKMRFPPRQELDFYMCSSPRFGTKNDTGLETCPDPKHEQMSAMGHEVGILLQVTRNLLAKWT